jgi:prophage regulatory protein
MSKRLLRLPEVKARTGLSSMSIYRGEKKNPPTFPRRIKVSANIVAWDEDAISAWIDDRISESRRSSCGTESNEPRSSADQR